MTSHRSVPSPCPVRAVINHWIYRRGVLESRLITRLRWYGTHQHMSKKLPSFDMLKNSSKLIYFDKNNRTLPCFLKSYLTSKIVKYEFFKISISHILKKVESEKCHIFSWEYATCYWLIKERKNSEKMHVAYFLS